MAGITAAVVTNDVVTNSTVTGSIAGPPGPGAQTFRELLASLLPDHHWPLNESSGDALDIGVGTALDGTPSAVVPFRQQVGPQVNGQDSPNISGASFNTGGPRYYTSSPIPSHSTGTVGFWARLLDDGSTDHITIGSGNAPSSVQFWEMKITDAGAAAVGIRTATAPATAMSAFTDPATHTVGEWVFVIATQPGDGVGPRLFINGVPVTTNYTQQNGLSLDSWFNSVAVPSNFRIGNRGGGLTTPQFDGSIQDVFIFEGTVLTNSQILALYNASQTPAAPAANFTELIRGYAPTIWHRMHEESDTLVPSGNMEDWPVPSGTPTYRQAGPLVNEVPSFSIDLDAGDHFLGSGVITPSTGSVIIFLNTDTIAATGGHVFTMGNSTSTEYIFFGRFSDTLYHGVVGNSGVNLLQVQITSAALSISTATWYMFVITQDGGGGGPRMFVDGVEYSGGQLSIITQGTGSLDDWFDTPISPTRTRIGVVPGTGNQNQFLGLVGQVIVLPNVLTPAEITTLYNSARV